MSQPDAHTTRGPFPSEWRDLWWVCEDGVTWALCSTLVLRRRKMNRYAGRTVAVKPSKRGRRG